MTLTRIQALLEACATESPPFPPTLLYNEGWLLRLVMDWFARQDLQDHLLSPLPGARWFSEALLPSAFLPRPQGDPLAESWTHADGAIGHFTVGGETKTGLSLLPDASQILILEAKLFSPLARGVAHASYFDQAARTVACVAEILQRAGRHPGDLSRLGFYVLAPQSQIDAGAFTRQMDRDSIRAKVQRRVAAYNGERDAWHRAWFEPTLSRIDLGQSSWEDLLAEIRRHDEPFGDSLGAFYARCLQFNEP